MFEVVEVFLFFKVICCPFSLPFGTFGISVELQFKTFFDNVNNRRVRDIEVNTVAVFSYDVVNMLIEYFDRAVRSIAVAIVNLEVVHNVSRLLDKQNPLKQLTSFVSRLTLHVTTSLFHTTLNKYSNGREGSSSLQSSFLRRI